MKHSRTIGALAGLVLSSATGTAAAAIVGPVTVDFNGLVDATVFGTANVAPGGGSCGGIGPCWLEEGAVVGVVEVPTNLGAHLHRTGPETDRAIGYEADTSGIYLRADDNSAFGLVSLDFSAPISPENPDNGPNDFWEILGFDTAVNLDLESGDGTNYATRVAYQTVANGFDGTLVLDPAFANINAFWIHYNGYPSVPLDGKSFFLEVDDINLTAAAVAPVPIPAAVWLFGSGLLGFAASARKKA